MGARLAVLIILLLAVFCGAAPAFAQLSCLRCHQPHEPQWLDCVACHRGDARSVRKNIAHRDFLPGRFAHFNLPDSEVVAAGRKLLDASACRRCHVWDQKGNRLASDLDQSTQRFGPQDALIALREPAAFMPDFRLREDQMTALVNALFAAGINAPKRQGEQPQMIHFDVETAGNKNPFVKHCGACHRLLTSHQGGLGSGDIAPHLAGLLGEHFPRTYKEEEAWSQENLKKWLDNPRKSRPAALMSPVLLEEGTYKELLLLIEPPE